MNTIFGPVQSRRLGLSLGVDIVPLKTCSLSCVFCQVGATPQTTITRRQYISAREILDELEAHLKTGAQPDWITFSGSGEPTLNSAIGEIIRSIKAMTDIPVCVITNGTMLLDSAVRHDVAPADAVMPSLHSAVEETYRKICNSHKELSLDKIIDGLAEFRKMYTGKIWLEILFVKGMNDSPAEIEALSAAIKRIDPDSIQLNTVVRPPAESTALPVSGEKLEEIRAFFGPKAEIIAPQQDTPRNSEVVTVDDVRKYLLRRPGNIEEISKALGASNSEIEHMIESLSDSGEITKSEFSGKPYWEYVK
jgi:wyosine [tRNA(Phe)-imidazoG37] synthetase (radical SAM superfamily)